VSIFTVLLVQGTQTMHAQLAEHVTPFNRMLQSGGAYFRWSPIRPRGVAALNQEVTHQAAISAYSNDFLIMMMVTLGMALFLLLVRVPPRKSE
jgi:DHA2 family multidrug resistance protein